MQKFIYKICSSKEWTCFKKKGKFYGSKKDLLDGYIHLSKKKQVTLTLKRHFFKKGNLVLLKVDASKLTNLVWEKSRNNLLFPHLYSSLKLNHIKNIYKIILKKNKYNFTKLNF